MPFDGNTVPLGEAGTGAAYILPQSQAINQISDYLDKRTKDQQDAQAASAKQAASLAKTWQQNRLNIKAGTLWQPEINAKVNDVMQKGIALRKAGIDPSQYYNNPNIQKSVEDYNNDRMAAVNMGEARDAFAKQAEPIDKQISEDDGSLDPASIKAHHDFFNMPLSQIMANGYQMPGVSKAFNEQKAVDALPTSKIDTTTLPDANGVEKQLILPNKDAHLRTAANYVNNTPQVRSLISKQTGIPFDQIGNETDPGVIKQQLDAQYRSLPNIPSLAAQGVKTFGGLAGSNTNSNGVPDAAAIPPKEAGSVPGTPYDDLLNTQAAKLAAAAKLKQAKIQDAYQQLNDKVGETNKQTLNFKYQEEQDRRERMGMDRERFNDWLDKQQSEKGSFSLGNQNSYVPVAKQYVNKDIGGSAGVEPEKGASLYGVNLPGVETVVRPSTVTNTNTGKTIKNTDPMNVKVSQMQMVPVFQGLDKEGFNGSEISAKQLKAIINGTNTDGATLKNISFQPYVYGVQTQRVTDPATKAAHLQDIPVKFSYDALKGSGIKKINTATFDQATDQLKQIQANPKFQGLTPQQKIDFLSKKYNLNLD